jgi:hypothetical protein
MKYKFSIEISGNRGRKEELSIQQCSGILQADEDSVLSKVEITVR